MPVIYLPEDKRWQLMGQGIGELVGAYAGNRLKQADDMRVWQDIQQIQSSSTDPNAVPQEIAARHGFKGIALYNALQRQRLNQAHMEQSQAQTGLARARTQELTGPTGEMKREKLAAETSLAQTKAQAEPTELALRIQNIKSEIEKRNAEMSQLPTKAAKDAAELDIAQLNVQLKQAEITQNRNAAQMFGAAAAQPGGEGQPSVAEQVAGRLQLSEPQMAGAQLGFATGGAKGAEGAVRSAQSANRAVTGIPGTKTLPEQAIAQSASASQQATGMRSVLQEVENDPSMTGGPQNLIKDWLLKHGFATDPEFSQLAAASSQLVAQNATSGSGWVGRERVAIAREISPSVIKGKIYSIQELNQISHDAVARLESRAAAYGPEYRKEGLDKAISEMKAIAERTDSLWWTAPPTDAQGKQTGPPKHFYYGGKEVDPKTLRPIPSGSKELDHDVKIPGGKTFRADDVNWIARKKGLTPEAAEEFIRASGQSG